MVDDPGDAFADNAAGDYAIIKGEIGADIQGKSMHSDPFGDPHADSSNFTVANPDSGEFFNSFGGDSIERQQIDQYLFDGMHIPTNALLMMFQIKNRVPDQLPGAVIGNVAAAVHIINFDALTFQIVLGGD